MNGIELVERIKKVLRFTQFNIFHPNLLDYCENLKNLDVTTLKNLYLYILSEDKEVINAFFYFVDILKNENCRLENYLADPIIEKIYKKANKVRREIHRMKGLLRFREVYGGYLYAQFRPENNIILPLAIYFSNRLRNESALIHDIKRNILAFCHSGKVYPAKMEGELPPLTQDEKIYSRLWLQYFDKISIKERMNLKIQKQKVPLKYRNLVIEFIGDSLK